MKISESIFFFFLLVVFVSCKRNDVLQTVSVPREETKKSVRVEEKKPAVVESKNEQEDFNSFLKIFSNDSLFQRDRIHFPLKVKINNDDFELVDYLITKEEYRNINLDVQPQSMDYKQVIHLKEEEAVIQQRGINNGIYIDYFFKRKNGKWQLSTWIDVST
jgi:hypothetical protein